MSVTFLYLQFITTQRYSTKLTCCCRRPPARGRGCPAASLSGWCARSPAGSTPAARCSLPTERPTRPLRSRRPRLQVRYLWDLEMCILPVIFNMVFILFSITSSVICRQFVTTLPIG